MPITAEFDREADALYVRIGDAPRQRTIEINDTTYVDVDDAGRAVGLELLYPSLGLDLEDIAARAQLHHHLPGIFAAIAQAGVPGVASTLTGASYLASTAVTTFVVEGTVPAGQGFVASSGVTGGDPIITACA